MNAVVCRGPRTLAYALRQYMLTTMSQATKLAEALDTRDPAVGLPAVAALRRLLDKIEATQVTRARKLNWSWEAIGASLGVTRQTVHKKYRSSDGPK